MKLAGTVDDEDAASVEIAAEVKVPLIDALDCVSLVLEDTALLESLFAEYPKMSLQLSSNLKIGMVKIV